MTEEEKKQNEADAAHNVAAEANRNAEYVDLWRKTLPQRQSLKSTSKRRLKGTTNANGYIR